jgi:pyoverdine/dityrosine biosynthesis protein Dit1
VKSSRYAGELANKFFKNLRISHHQNQDTSLLWGLNAMVVKKGFFAIYFWHTRPLSRFFVPAQKSILSRLIRNELTREEKEQYLGRQQ